jgi:hypothetical protein
MFVANIQFNNEYVNIVTCPNGHSFEMNILIDQFSLLFDNGLYALYNKFYIEAFTSFVMSYERFLEYCIKVILYSNDSYSENYDDVWKKIASQSERQLGAFILLYYNKFKLIPTLLSDANTKLRNKVIHKGYIPSENECLKFGNSILKIIRDIFSVLLSDLKSKDALLFFSNLNFKAVSLSYLPYQKFPINRPVNETENKSIEDFINELDFIVERDDLSL